ncbi:tyrosinase family protein [Castellaniella sp.]|uniref:tyrosinase family protein n=1 Tax=Castellaniella sp. TaxID=1955812 RepID=UPI002AFE68A4|nr:tyrosinase family protein [Castellaniella sp.]
MRWGRRAGVLVSLVMLISACDGGIRSDVPPSPGAERAAVVQPVVRKNVNNLTLEEKAEFVEAILRLKQARPPESDEVGNWYDHFVASHMRKLVCWTDEPNQGGFGHNGPDILTWHRAFLLEFERAMSTVMGKPMAIPYWDWTDPASIATVFADDFMGGMGDPNAGYYVMSGPFKKGDWRINVKGFESTNPGQFDWLVRAVGNMPGMSTLPSREEVQQAMLRTQYDVAPWGVVSDLDVSFRAFVDGSVNATGTECDGGIVSITGATTSLVHGTVHMWVGGADDQGNPGSLTDTATSPNDPVFWLHHAYIDLLTETWWAANNYQYLPVSGGPRGSNRDDRMWPYLQTNGSMAVPVETLGYRYDALFEIELGTTFIPVAKWLALRGAYNDLCSPSASERPGIEANSSYSRTLSQLTQSKYRIPN